MIPRKQLDASPGDIAAGLLACAGKGSAPPGRDRAGRPLLCARPDSLVCLSVRSGFDLLLGELAWPAGDEVLVTAITIPDMSRILREHGLQPVPVDLDPATLAPDEAALERAVTPRTRAILVAHLFGARLPLDRLVAWAHGRGLLVLEDCAQAFNADGFDGHAASDVRMFSFGTIKTSTAFGGGVMLVRDAALRARLAERHARWPVQRTGAYAQKLLKFGAFLLVQHPWAYGLLFRVIRWSGRDPDAVVMALGRGFAGADFFARLRHQPCAALRWLLARRLAAADPVRVQQRAAAGEFVLARLDTVRPLGARAEHRTHWLFPLCVKNADALLPVLARAGFDATRASSSLHALPDGGGGRAPRAQAAMAGVLYVPVYAAMGERRLAELAALLNARAEPAE
jgi:dTDP-4-amino-4,6-dideoxygalactose transaminase